MGQQQARPPGYAARKLEHTKDDISDERAFLNGRILPPPPSEDAEMPAFADLYTLGEEIGKGCSGVVHKATRKDTGEVFAVKIVDKSKVLDARMLVSEVKVMRRMRHPNLVQLVDVLETDDLLYMVMELASGGELFDHIIAKGTFNEREAAHIVTDIVEGIRFLHSKNVIHRDLKPENVLFEHDGEGAELKLADFGFAAVADDDDIATDCGTVEYIAPETLTEQKWLLASDMWSLGVIAYILLCGFHPFQHDDRAKFLEYIVTANYEFPDPEWTAVSSEAKDMISSLLVLDPSKRLTIEQAAAHPWLRKYRRKKKRSKDTTSTKQTEIPLSRTLSGRAVPFHYNSPNRTGNNNNNINSSSHHPNANGMLSVPESTSTTHTYTDGGSYFLTTPPPASPATSIRSNMSLLSTTSSVASSRTPTAQINIGSLAIYTDTHKHASKVMLHNDDVELLSRINLERLLVAHEHQVVARLLDSARRMRHDVNLIRQRISNTQQQVQMVSGGGQ